MSNPAIQVIPANACGLGQPSSIEIEMISFPDTPAKPFGPDSLCTTTDTIAQYQISESVAGASSYEWELLPEEAGTIYGEGIMADVHWVKNWIGQATIRIRAMNSCGSSYWSEVLNVHTFSCLGIHDFEKKLVSIMVYPNPTNGQLNIEFTGIEAKQEFRLYIRNLYGRLLFSDVLDSGIPKSTVDISHLSPGMYILSFEGGDGIWASEKLILSR